MTPRCGAGLKTCCFFSFLFFSFSISEELQNSFHIFFLACFLLVIYLFLMRERKNNNKAQMPIEPNALSVLKWHRGRTQGRISAEITAGLNAGPRPQRFVPRTHSDPPAPPGREWGRRPREGSAEGGEDLLSVCSVVQRPGQLWGCCRPCLLCKPLNAGRGHPSCDRPFHRVGVSVEALSPSLLFRRAPRAKGDFSRPSPLTPPHPVSRTQPTILFNLAGIGAAEIPPHRRRLSLRERRTARPGGSGRAERPRSFPRGTEVFASRSGTARSSGPLQPPVPGPASRCVRASQCRSDTAEPELGENRGVRSERFCHPQPRGRE